MSRTCFKGLREVDAGTSQCTDSEVIGAVCIFAAIAAGFGGKADGSAGIGAVGIVGAALELSDRLVGETTELVGAAGATGLVGGVGVLALDAKLLSGGNKFKSLFNTVIPMERISSLI